MGGFFAPSQTHPGALRYSPTIPPGSQPATVWSTFNGPGVTPRFTEVDFEQPKTTSSNGEQGSSSQSLGLDNNRKKGRSASGTKSGQASTVLTNDGRLG